MGRQVDRKSLHTSEYIFEGCIHRPPQEIRSDSLAESRNHLIIYIFLLCPNPLVEEIRKITELSGLVVGVNRRYDAIPVQVPVARSRMATKNMSGFAAQSRNQR